MDIDKLIERLNIDAADWAGDHHIKVDLTDAAIALSKFQTAQQLVLDYVNALNGEVEKLRDELEQVKRERDAAKSPEVIEAVDELVEFARTRMCTADWLYYANVLGEWRGQKED